MLAHAGQRVNGPRPAGRPRNRNQVLTTRVGLQFPAGLTFEEWAETGPKLSRVVDAFAWCLGDWLVYGQRKYESRYGEAVEKVGLDYQTLRNYAWVARKYRRERRREGLSFQHHAEAASLPPDEQDYWLDRAEEHGWSKTELRQKIREARSDARSAEGGASILPRVRVESERMRNWRAAAIRTGADLTSWIVATLDQEAVRTLRQERPEPG